MSKHASNTYPDYIAKKMSVDDAFSKARCTCDVDRTHRCPHCWPGLYAIADAKHRKNEA